MIDIHTHILPGLDDGSPDLENSLHFLEMMAASELTDVFVTPHYIVGEYDNTPDIIERSRVVLAEAAKDKGLSLNIHKGVELYLSAHIDEELNLREYCLGNSDYILVETALNGFPASLLEILYKIVKKGYKPILAHPERYTDIIKNTTLAEDLIYRNVYMQANAGSFLGLYGDQIAKTVWELYHKGFIHFIGSDCHCRRDEYVLPITKKMLTEHYPDYNPELFTDTNPAKILSNDSIEYFNPAVKQANNGQGNIFKKLLQLFYED